ncbi:hypothetical protein RSOLAG1IB_09387 [Rhizoctonia solani AG-1 IB]|uniref:Transmembrane protein n=1 Tax=Thanatephorus cucumeris (strain AG1-IB / isolate 7/3/14) TaxID=1108050 RepID=A0A0B7FV81_THACB|nr:hypothetical protein RSOLAG1IB_09387 [Rhizoctonia solani AG-1 IB]
MLAHRILVFVGLIAGIVRAGNTTCKTTSLDWYTRSVGETPCRTYERMRQICDRDYQVGDFRTSIPGDNCGGQPATCCCNSVSFALSMLCMNCQHGTGSGVFGDPGIDAEVGSYEVYLNHCVNPTNKNLRNDVQLGVCQQGIKLPAFLYSIFWRDGPWFYGAIKEYAQLDISGGKNNTGLCTEASSADNNNSEAATTTLSEAGKSRVPVGAIAGGVVAGVVLLIGSVFLGFFISKRQQDKKLRDLIEQRKPLNTAFEYYDPLVGATVQSRELYCRLT